MILSAQSIRRCGIITPFCERTVAFGMSYGLSSCGYDIRIAQDVLMTAHQQMRFRLASTIEHFDMPDDVVGRVHDKSTWARQGLQVFNTVIEPGWRGYLTLELALNGTNVLDLKRGMPIAQIIFEFLDKPTEQPYAGKYMDQPDCPVAAKMEE